jgi:hypothetical protein
MKIACPTGRCATKTTKIAREELRKRFLSWSSCKLRDAYVSG